MYCCICGDYGWPANSNSDQPAILSAQNTWESDGVSEGVSDDCQLGVRTSLDFPCRWAMCDTGNIVGRGNPKPRLGLGLGRGRVTRVRVRVTDLYP